MGSRALTFVAVCFIACTPAHALTAVCKNPVGRISGVHGTALGGKSFDEADAISNATFTFLWNRGESEATIVSQSSGGSASTKEAALLIFDSEEQLTFLVVYESAVWIYSVYPLRKMVLMTSHNNGVSIDSGGAVVKSYQATCDIGE
jgi:hypothetical protein